MNNFLPKLKKPWAYARILLEFLQENPELKVTGLDFLLWRRNFPFLGMMPTARLSELKEMWLVEIVEKRKWKKIKTATINVYQITEKGLKFTF